jgi:hypothetical protein
MALSAPTSESGRAVRDLATGTVSEDRWLWWSCVLGELLSTPVRFSREEALEVHTLVGHRELMLYMLAIKSLHRFMPRVRVVVHDDGTLTWFDHVLLGLHVRGGNVISKRAADAQVELQLRRYPRLLHARRRNVRLCQLIDYNLLASTERIIGMDSDVVFLDRPDAVHTWAREGQTTATILYSPERAPKGPHWIPELLPAAPYVADLCCGFVCVDIGRFFVPADLERILARVPDAVLDCRRFVTQMLYSLMAARRGQRAASLGELYESGRLRWLPRLPERVLCHYFASHERRGAAQNLLEERELFAGVLARPLPRLIQRSRSLAVRP